MVDISQTKKLESEQSETPVSPDLGLPKPVDVSMHEALKTTVETLRQDQQIEKIPTAETGKEAPVVSTSEQKPTEPIAPVSKIETTVPTIAPAPIVIQTKDELTEEIEGVLSANLEDDFKRMSPELQIQFKVKGEATAIAISTILKSSKIQVKKIINLILNWLRIIPGVNHYFLTQEAKIKSDKVLMLREEIIKDKGKII